MRHDNKVYKLTQAGRRAVEEMIETMDYLKRTFGNLPGYKQSDINARNCDDANRVLFYFALESIWNGHSDIRWREFYEENHRNTFNAELLGPEFKVHEANAPYYGMTDDNIDEALDTAVKEKWIVSEFAIPFEFDSVEGATAAGKLLFARLQEECGGSWVHEVIVMQAENTWRVKANLIGVVDDTVSVLQAEQGVWFVHVYNKEHDVDFDGPNSSTPEGAVKAGLEKYNKMLLDQSTLVSSIYNLLKSKY